MKFFNWKKIITIVIIIFASIFVSFFLIILFTNYINWLLCIINSETNVSISSTIYFLTLLAIIYYSFETKRLREATSGRPLISIIKNVSDTIEVRNDGSNIAFNIKIYFYYNDRKALNKPLGIAVLGKGLSQQIGISDMEINKGNSKKIKLSDLISASPPDKNLKVLIVYSDSPEDKNQFKNKWRPDETVIMNTAKEGRFRMVYDKKIT